jgi:hypothetical protein
MPAVPTTTVALLTVVAAAAARRYAVYRPALKHVAPEFRNLLLLLIPHSVTRRTLRIRRLAMQLPTSAGRTV